MRFYKIINNGYIDAIGCGLDGMEITESEYAEILETIHSKPSRTETTDYHLKEDLSWEAYDVEPIVPSEDIDPDEAIEILLGGVE